MTGYFELCFRQSWYGDCRRRIRNRTAPNERIGRSTNNKPEKSMKKYRCIVCGWIYDPAQGDPDGGIAPGTPFEDIPDEWSCPLCGVGKDQFEPVEE